MQVQAGKQSNRRKPQGDTLELEPPGCLALGHSVYSHLQKHKAGPYLTPHTNSNSKWVQDLHEGAETIKPLRKKHRGKSS